MIASLVRGSSRRSFETTDMKVLIALQKKTLRQSTLNSFKPKRRHSCKIMKQKTLNSQKGTLVPVAGNALAPFIHLFVQAACTSYTLWRQWRAPHVSADFHSLGQVCITC